MSDLVTIRAVVGTEPQLSITPQGTTILKFRAATHERKRDPQSGEWSDAGTNWFSVSCFRGLAENAMESLRRGDRVIIYGKLQIRQFERTDGSTGTSADLEAYGLGHDLKFGTGSFTRVRHEGTPASRSAHPEATATAEDKSDAPVVTHWPEGDTEAA
ncbi:single-stranded DNA-binding protein [Glutamicibacter sp. MNS18]|uniref:single-stranded DNA-binding protein n=1 Tax=Glutamicibacter sp. MNS18 TaxID=2989817 RepID=UPI0022366FE1|nr:single-stranded DNA-binding protein [Glutamicibacter sp. MNS18]MCW4464635.1 single-stranded DNA-binding protein [Glutamicibacter sp. MNS18]